MKWLALITLLGGCLIAPDPPYGFRYEWSQAWDGPMPGPMHGAKLTFDEKRGTIVMYAGHNHNELPSGLVWEWDGGQWNEICAGGDVVSRTRPPGVYLPGFAWDGDHDRLVLVGGTQVLGPSSFMFSNEIWTCDDDTGAWSSAGTIKQARGGASLVYMPGSHELALVGGRNGTGQIQNTEIAPTDTLAFGFDDVSMRFPSAGAGQTATFDSDSGHILALASELSFDDSLVPHDEVWSYDGLTWTKLCDACSGTGKSDASIVHLEGSVETYVIGGYVGLDASNVARSASGTWLLDTGRLLEIDDAPPERNAIGVASTKGKDADSLLTFGGTAPPEECAQYECQDSFEYTIAP